MVKEIGVGLLLLGVLLSTSRGNAQPDMDTMASPKSFLSGKDWRGLSKGEQQAYAVGVVDGLELAYAYGKQGADLGWINACVTGMSSDRVRSMLGKEIEANPEEWKLLNVHLAMYRALKNACRQQPNR